MNSMRNELELFAIELARKAGKLIRESFLAQEKAEEKADHSPVTDTDKAIHKIFVESIQKKYPQHGILSEESKDVINPSAPYRWVCDPIDGTITFSHGIPTCAVSIALVKDGESILGVIYDPFIDRMVTAIKGRGAFLNGQRIHVSEIKGLKSAVIGTPIWLGSKFECIAAITELKKEDSFVVNLYSIAYMGMLVASGHMDGAYYFDRHAHDVAALKIIVEEAGGVVTNLDGSGADYRSDVQGQIISNKKLYPALLTLAETIT
jgi:myo-inositol-1(or 4)-monophosphatase